MNENLHSLPPTFQDKGEAFRPHRLSLPESPGQDASAQVEQQPKAPQQEVRKRESGEGKMETEGREGVARALRPLVAWWWWPEGESKVKEKGLEV